MHLVVVAAEIWGCIDGYSIRSRLGIATQFQTGIPPVICKFKLASFTSRGGKGRTANRPNIGAGAGAVDPRGQLGEYGSVPT